LSERLKYVDMVRGIAVLLMIVFQLFDMFSKDFGLYNTHYHMIKYVNWFPMFIIIAGFSLELMFDKYNVKTFYLKVLSRFLLFTLVSWFMIYWCQFKVDPLLFDGEIVGAIGLNLAFLSLFFLVEALQRNKVLRVAWFGSWCVIMVVLNGVLQIQPGFFGVFWLQSFMMFGVLLATSRNHSTLWLLSSLVLLILGLLNIGTVDLWNRNIEFLFLNFGFTGLVLSILRMTKINPLGRVLSYFGRHALFFYVFHYVLVYKILLLTNSGKTFGIFDSILLTLASVLVLVVLHKLKTLIKSHKIF
jgi:uncharacterized membrane protein